MTKRRKLSLFKLFSLLLFSYLLIGIILFLFQDIILFHPRSLPADHKYAFDYKYTEHNLTRNGRNLHLVKFLSDSATKGIVIYFHGNRRNIERYAGLTQPFTQKGYQVWMMDYPGFGKSTGKRTEQNIYEDGQLIYNHAVKELPASRVIIYGKSIGTGVASYVASKHPASKLILETPYYSIDAVAKHYFPIYPISPLTKYSFPVHQYLAAATMPVTIIHGTEDEVIPYKQSLRLKKEIPSITLITIEEGRHNNLASFPGYKTALDSLLIK